MLAWLHWLAITGGGLFAAGRLRASNTRCSSSALAFYYLAARNVLIRPGVSAAALAAWALTFQVGWAVARGPARRAWR